MEISRRGLFGLVSGVAGAIVLWVAPGKQDAVGGNEAPVDAKQRASDERFDYMCKRLQGKLGKDLYDCWFLSLDFEGYVGGVLTVSVPVSFLKHWLSAHYMRDLEGAAAQAFLGVWKVDLVQRKPRSYPGVAQQDVRRQLA